VTVPEVGAIVVTHGPHRDLADCLTSLGRQVDQVVVIANLPGPLPVPPGAVVIENARPVGFAENVNRGLAATTAPWVVIGNPDAVARPDAVDRLVSFGEQRPMAGILGPRLVYPDGRLQSSRRRFPTVAGTAVRRTPLRLAFPPDRWQHTHYCTDEEPDVPVPVDWLIGAFLLLRRRMADEIGGLDARFRLYGEDIDLGYRAARAGWERWFVPDAVVQHRFAAVIDRRFIHRHTLWHLRGMARYVHKHPESVLRLL
jgi:GT2 family glycosyltransferase